VKLTALCKSPCLSAQKLFEQLIYFLCFLSVEVAFRPGDATIPGEDEGMEQFTEEEGAAQGETSMLSESERRYHRIWLTLIFLCSWS